MNLYLIKSGNRVFTHEPLENQVLSFADFKRSLQTIKFFNQLQRFKDCHLVCFNKNYESNLLLTIIILRFIAKRYIYIYDESSDKQKITFLFFLKLFTKSFVDFFTKFFLILKIKRITDDLLKKINAPFKEIDFAQRPIYLRTDLWFGVKSGGSVGHIAGVINNLDKHFKTGPLLFSTDKIPTIKSEIPLILLQPTKNYWDFAELPSLASNLSFIEQFKNISLTNIGVIYQRYSLNNFLGAYLSILYNLPLIIEFNGSEVWISKNWGKALRYEKLSEKIEYLNLKRALLIVVVSQPIKNNLIKIGIDPQKILVNPNGVNPNVYNPNLDVSFLKESLFIRDKIVLGFIGTFGPWHGTEVLAEAFSLLIRKNPHLENRIHLLMIGDGVKKAEVQDVFKKNNLSNSVTFTGIVPQSMGPQYLACCDILVSPHIPNVDGTPFFGSPTKLFEYMSMAKGIVASDLDQIGEILKHNETALLVNPGSIDELAEAIYKLIINKELRETLGFNARKAVLEKFSWEIHTNNIITKLVETSK